MRIDVVGRNIKITDEVRSHAERRSEKILRHFDLVQQLVFTVEPAGRHNGSGVHCELRVDVEHHEDFVANATDDDLLRAIDSATAKADRQVSEYKDRLKNEKR